MILSLCTGKGITHCILNLASYIMSDMDIEFATVQLPSGLKMHYASDGISGAPALVFLHGYSDSWYSFSRIFPLLRDAFQLYAIDLRGHGNSDKPDHGYTMIHFAKDVREWLELMGIREVILCGHSMGTLIAQELALQTPEIVRQIVLFAPSSNGRSATLLEVQQMVQPLSDPVPEEFVKDFQASTIQQPVPVEFMKTVIMESLKLPAHVWKQAIDGILAADYVNDLHRIRMPVLALRGENDTVFSEKGQKTLVEQLPDVKIKIFSETAHAPHWERPKECVAELRQFVLRS